MDSTFLQEDSISRRRDLLKEWKAGREGEKWGWVDVNRLEIVGGADLTRAATFVHPDDDNAADQTVIRVPLPQPIPPQGSIELSVDFTSKLPRALARTGYDGDYILAGQWFPKIGVYEAAGERGRVAGGWNCHQFHANTEFYADYGDWDVDLTVPSNYVLGATGYLRRTRDNPDRTTTYNFYQEDVHDFAWTASPRFIKRTRTFDWKREVRGEEVATWARILNLPPDQVALRDVSVTLLLQPDHLNLADRYFRSAFNGLKYFGLWYGQYPYDTLTVVDPPRGSHTGGMEYPTFITGGAYFLPGEHSLNPEGVTVHEFGHQFWYGLVGNNEFEEAWLDEGFNTYSTGKVIETAYPHACNYELCLWHARARLPVAQRRAAPIPVRRGWEYPHGQLLSHACSLRSARTAACNTWKMPSRTNWSGTDGSISTARVTLSIHTPARALCSEPWKAIWALRPWRVSCAPISNAGVTVIRPRGTLSTLSTRSPGNAWSGSSSSSSTTRTSSILRLATFAANSSRVRPVFTMKTARRSLTSKRTLPGPLRKARTRSIDPPLSCAVWAKSPCPVDVVIRFGDGETVSRVWDGKYRWVKYVFEKPAKVVSAEVDPQRKLALSENFTANKRTAEPDNRAATKWYIRWIFWIENLFFAAGFFS